VDHSPAINPLLFDFLGPTMVEAGLQHDEIRGTDCNSDDVRGTESDDFEDKSCDESDEEDGVDNEGNEEEGPAPAANGWESHQPPSIQDAQSCLVDINQMLKPLQPKGRGGYKQCRLPLQLHTQLEWVASFLHIYTDTESGYGNGVNGSHWTALSLHATHSQQSTPRRAKNLQKWAKH
jgi:hypothetical protein